MHPHIATATISTISVFRPFQRLAVKTVNKDWVSLSRNSRETRSQDLDTMTLRHLFTTFDAKHFHFWENLISSPWKASYLTLTKGDKPLKMVHFKYPELPNILGKYLSTICFGQKLGRRDKKNDKRWKNAVRVWGGWWWRIILGWPGDLGYCLYNNKTATGHRWYQKSQDI